MLALSVEIQGIYYCQHFGGVCQQPCIDGEEMESHFALTHSPYNRMRPAFIKSALIAIIGTRSLLALVYNVREK